MLNAKRLCGKYLSALQIKLKTNSQKLTNIHTAVPYSNI